MIGMLTGEVRFVNLNSIILDIGGVGYLVYKVGFNPLIGQRVTVWIHDLVREDRRELYGFLDQTTKDLFEQIIEINGVGHKLAQKILEAHSADELRRHIIAGDLAFLTSLSGVGKKTAQKIILELKGVLVAETEESLADQDVVEALTSLGYKKQDLAQIIKHLDQGSTEDKIRQALKMLSK
jgi:Holliday junction DNA helicase RuvA